MVDPLLLPAGSLRHSILIQSRSTQPDSFGQPLDTWNTVLVTRASIAIATQRELYQANQLTSQVSHTITLHWPGSAVVITPGMQIVYGTHTYKIQDCDNVGERNRVLRLLCLELNGAA